ncbi:hypothetical protein H6G97_38085 [Nostoc flagelliforme FACHB-838]|uniref:Uncharacterized protein n=1 Tax=Nostoc flagelliforme FACHB-838 TaxID=2692904 RepID=A0ABR8DZN4_9NOSO|nr:hypothetical protein [Nostoc flagelliforme]MBD2534937.1 hypothetical protein [Nostoc flagelliforme FACHB-838]
MTHPKYTQQALCRYNLPRIKRIAAELGATPIGDRRATETWVNAIITHQSTKLQKVDNQALAQAELDHFIADQAQVVAPESLTIVEISFDHHEYYADDKLVASISHDDNHLTQRWVVMVNDKEIFRANTLMRCDRFICTHYKDGSLPVQEKETTPCTTGNEIMAQIFNECEKYGFEILDDGIYHNDVKLGEVGCTDGSWWVMRTGECQKMPCASAVEAVQSLSMVNVSTDDKSIFDKYFLEQPLEQLTGDKLQRLLERTELVTA